MSLMNFRTAILCGMYCLCTCSLAVNAQEVTIEFGSVGSGPLATSGRTGDNFNNFRDTSVERFIGTPNLDGITTSNRLAAPITHGVPEAGDAGLELTLVNATATTGVDGFEGENRARISISFGGIGMRGANQRVFPDIEAVEFDSAAQFNGIFRLDSSHDEILTFAFNQDVTVSSIVLGNLGPGETFQFGAATKITDLSDLNLPDLTPGTLTGIVEPFPANMFTFETPLAITAGEEIPVGQTGFDPSTLTNASTGVALVSITLTLSGGDSPLIGDVNRDGEINFDDIPFFLALLINEEFQAEADINGDGEISFDDIPDYITLLIGA